MSPGFLHSPTHTVPGSILLLSGTLSSSREGSMCSVYGDVTGRREFECDYKYERQNELGMVEAPVSDHSRTKHLLTVALESPPDFLPRRTTTPPYWDLQLISLLQVSLAVITLSSLTTLDLFISVNVSYGTCPPVCPLVDDLLVMSYPGQHCACHPR